MQFSIGLGGRLGGDVEADATARRIKLKRVRPFRICFTVYVCLIFITAAIPPPARIKAQRTVQI